MSHCAWLRKLETDKRSTPKMDKPLGQHITELERRIQQLSQEMMRSQKTRTELGRIENELWIAQQALDFYKEAFKLEGQLQHD